MTHTLRLGCLVVLLTSPLLASPGAPAYSVIGLGGVSRALAINDHTQIVGWNVPPPPGFDFKAVLWEAGQMRDLGALPGGIESTATGINNRGQIVLYSEAINCRGLCSRAALWEKGTLTDLGALGRPAIPSDINDRGQVVGVSHLGQDFISPRRAVLWESQGGLIDLGTLPGDNQSEAHAINNRGQIIGISWNQVFSGRPFLWTDGVMTELPGLSDALDINDRGQIVGAVRAGGRFTPVVWENGTMTPLPLPPGSWSILNAAINARGQVVGTLVTTSATTPTHEFRIAVLWQNGTVIVLPTLSPTGQAQAADINNRGEIVGDSGQAVLWLPHER